MPGSHLALVICHRWFKTGEGWAWADSWRDDDLKQARTLIQNDLASLRRPDQGARYRHRRGVLLVRTTNDLDCPDPLARPRHPVLITGVFVPNGRMSDCSPGDEESLLQEAETMCRRMDSPGTTSGLTLALPPGVTNAIRRRTAVRISGYLALMVIAMCGGVLAVSQGGGFEGFKEQAKEQASKIFPNTNDKNIHDWAKAVNDRMRQWGVQEPAPQAASSDGDTQSKAINQFLALLARQKAWGPLDGHHIDYAFLRRPPELAAKVENSPKEADVRSVMLDLLGSFSVDAKDKLPGQATKQQGPTPEDIVSAIATQTDYRVWYTGEQRELVFDGRSKPLDTSELDYLYRFCAPVAGINDGGLPKSLYDTMVGQWGVSGLTDEDLKRRPWFIVGSFFEFVSIHAASDRGASQKSAANETHDQQTASAAIERLRKHLPADSVVARNSLRDGNLELVIRNGLRELATMLDVPTNGRDDRTILGDVKTRLKQVAESSLEAVPTKDMLPSTQWYLERLACRNPVPQKGAPSR